MIEPQAAPQAQTATYPQVLAWIGKISLVVELLKSQNVAIPGVVSDALSMLSGIAKSFNGATPPTNIEELLAEAVPVLEAVKALTGHSVLGNTLQDVLNGVQWGATQLHDLLDGQFAVVATSHISHEGVTIPVALVAIRMDKGDAADKVGFTGAPDVTPPPAPAPAPVPPTQPAAVETVPAPVSEPQTNVGATPAENTSESAQSVEGQALPGDEVNSDL